jgi:hypothetical protein
MRSVAEKLPNLPMLNPPAAARANQWQNRYLTLAFCLRIRLRQMGCDWNEQSKEP